MPPAATVPASKSVKGMVTRFSSRPAPLGEQLAVERRARRQRAGMGDISTDDAFAHGIRVNTTF